MDVMCKSNTKVKQSGDNNEIVLKHRVSVFNMIFIVMPYTTKIGGILLITYIIRKCKGSQGTHPMGVIY